MLVLDAHNTAAPVSSESLVLVELSAEVLGKNFEVLEVLRADIGESDTSGSLLMDVLAETCFTLNNGEGDSLLSAKSREESEDLKGINVVSNNNELSFALFNELSNVVETELDNNWLGSLLGISTTLLGLSLTLESDLLFLV